MAKAGEFFLDGDETAIDVGHSSDIYSDEELEMFRHDNR